MRRPGEEGPVFVIGAPRSGTRILAWSLGQHPRLHTTVDGRWIGRLTRDLAAAFHRAGVPPGRSQLRIAGTTPEAFFQAFGPAVTRVQGFGPSPRGRWVDGAPGNVLDVLGLSRLFPRARFIHVVRGVGPVARSLTEVGTPDDAYFTPASAVQTWVRSVRAGIRAERALGPGAVLRVLYRDLSTASVTTIRECLSFVGEPFHSACLRPLRGLAADADEALPDDGSALVREARELSRRLLAGQEPPPVPSPDEREALADEFILQGEWEARSADPATPLDRIRILVRSAVPEGATVLVVSRGDESLVRLPGRTGWHYPQEEGGVYAGYHPADSGDAISHLEELRERGADFLLFPCTAFWWFDHYDGLRTHLERRYRLVAYGEDSALIYALRQPPAGPPVRVAAGGEGRRDPAREPREAPERVEA